MLSFPNLRKLIVDVRSIRSIDGVPLVPLDRLEVLELSATRTYHAAQLPNLWWMLPQLRHGVIEVELGDIPPGTALAHRLQGKKPHMLQTLILYIRCPHTCPHRDRPELAEALGRPVAK